MVGKCDIFKCKSLKQSIACIYSFIFYLHIFVVFLDSSSINFKLANSNVIFTSVGQYLCILL